MVAPVLYLSDLSCCELPKKARGILLFAATIWDIGLFITTLVLGVLGATSQMSMPWGLTCAYLVTASTITVFWLTPIVLGCFIVTCVCIMCCNDPPKVFPWH